jgi:hypothetical protein
MPQSEKFQWTVISFSPNYRVSLKPNNETYQEQEIDIHFQPLSADTIVSTVISAMACIFAKEYNICRVG